MNSLPAWMRAALFAAAAMNLGGAFDFLPGAQAMRDLAGFPEAGHPVYVATVGIFIFVLGLGYLACEITNHLNRLFIAVGAIGKPVEGAELVVTLPHALKAAEAKTDANGQAAFTAKAGDWVAIRAMVPETASGKPGDKAYNRAVHYSTLTFFHAGG